MFGKPAVKHDSLWADICNLMFGRKVYRTPKVRIVPSKPNRCNTCNDTGQVWLVDGSVFQDEIVPCPTCRPKAHAAAISTRNTTRK